MSDVFGRDITVNEIAPMGQPIEAAPETTAAFVGRALRGPLNRPVLVRSYGEFRRRFGGSWSRSSLGPAVRGFFEHGGRDLYVVRVANAARAAMLRLPAGGSTLVLSALEPGSTERIRAAVDYDRIDPADSERFNLTLQRIDLPTGTVADQEIYRGASFLAGARDFVGDLLTTSSLVRIERPFPAHRPEPTCGEEAPFRAGYIGHAQDGADGIELSDYDLIGSRTQGTGLFALRDVGHIDLLYLPPPGKLRDIGPAAVLAAELFCRERGAMLIVDPIAEWATPAEAIAGMREQGYRSPNMLGYFPRVVPRDCRDDHARPAGGALAGLLCRHDRQHGVWHRLAEGASLFDRSLLAAFDVDDKASSALIREGLNVIVSGRAHRPRLRGNVTMARGSESHRRFTSLPVRRLCLRIVKAIDCATRGAVFEPDDPGIAARARSQILAYFAALSGLGAFENDRFVVVCEAGLCRYGANLVHGMTILIVFQPRGCAEPLAFTLQQTPAGCRVASTAFAPVLEACA